MNMKSAYTPLLVLTLLGGLLLPAPSAMGADVTNIIEQFSRRGDTAGTELRLEERRAQPRHEQRSGTERKARDGARNRSGAEEKERNRGDRQDSSGARQTRERHDAARVDTSATRSQPVTRRDGDRERRDARTSVPDRRKTIRNHDRSVAGRVVVAENHDRRERYDRRNRYDSRDRQNRNDRARHVVRRVEHRLPSRHAVIVHGKDRYHYYAGRFYRSWNSGYILVRPPLGLVVLNIPLGTRTVISAGFTYYVFGDVYYRLVPGGYQVVEPLRAPARDWPARVTVVTDLLNVRYGPESSEDIIAQVDRYTILHVLGSAPGWLYVEIEDSDVQGWVMERYVSADLGRG
jgi:hypothetical protein